MSRHRRRARVPAATLAVLLATSLMGGEPAGAGAGPRDITMRDDWYQPSTAVVGQRQRVAFTNFGRVVHDANDGTGLGLFDTDLLEAPQTETVGPLPGAGRYRYYCTFHPEMVGRLVVPLRLSTARVRSGAAVTVRWAARRAPAGMVFDVQRRRPGTTRFVAWRTGVTVASTKWWPRVRGTWAVRARVRAVSGGGASGWSPARTLRVT